LLLDHHSSVQRRIITIEEPWNSVVLAFRRSMVNPRSISHSPKVSSILRRTQTSSGRPKFARVKPRTIAIRAALRSPCFQHAPFHTNDAFGGIQPCSTWNGEPSFSFLVSRSSRNASWRTICPRLRGQTVDYPRDIWPESRLPVEELGTPSFAAPVCDHSRQTVTRVARAAI